MNEQTKELALKSGIIYLSEQTAYFKANDGLTVLPSVDSLEKFAALIIEECVDYAFANGDNVDYLKQYFGVE